MSGVKCAKCEDNLEPSNNIMMCNSCKKSFHTMCLGLKSDRIQFLQSSTRGVFPICGDCDLNARITFMEREVCRLAGEIEMARERNTGYAAESLAFEISDRVRRSRNLIVFNLPESLQPDEQRRQDEDRYRIIREILTFCFVDTTNISVQRLGKPAGNAPRPLRVYLNKERDVCIVLNCRNRCTSGLIFKPDKTTVQRKLHQEVRVSLGSLKDQGNINKGIKYIRGVPVIVDIEPQQYQDEARALVPMFGSRNVNCSFDRDT